MRANIYLCSHNVYFADWGLEVSNLIRGEFNQFIHFETNLLFETSAFHKLNLVWWKLIIDLNPKLRDILVRSVCGARQSIIDLAHSVCLVKRHIYLLWLAKPQMLAICGRPPCDQQASRFARNQAPSWHIFSIQQLNDSMRSMRCLESKLKHWKWSWHAKRQMLARNNLRIEIRKWSQSLQILTLERTRQNYQNYLHPKR